MLALLLLSLLVSCCVHCQPTTSTCNPPADNDQQCTYNNDQQRYTDLNNRFMDHEQKMLQEMNQLRQGYTDLNRFMDHEEKMLQEMNQLRQRILKLEHGQVQGKTSQKHLSQLWPQVT